MWVEGGRKGNYVAAVRMELAGAGGACEQSWRRHEEWQGSLLKVSPKEVLENQDWVCL